jgi:hypothetical protein
VQVVGVCRSPVCAGRWCVQVVCVCRPSVCAAVCQSHPLHLWGIRHGPHACVCVWDESCKARFGVLVQRLALCLCQQSVLRSCTQACRWCWQRQPLLSSTAGCFPLAVVLSCAASFGWRGFHSVINPVHECLPCVWLHLAPHATVQRHRPEHVCAASRGQTACASVAPAVSTTPAFT